MSTFFQVKDKMYQAAHWVSTQSLPLAKDSGSLSGHEVSRGSDSSSAEAKRSKKEVSFSLADDLEKDQEADADTSGSFGSVFSSQPVTTPENNNMVSCSKVALIRAEEVYSLFSLPPPSSFTTPASHYTYTCAK